MQWCSKSRQIWTRCLILLVILAACNQKEETPTPAPPSVFVITPEQYSFGGGTLLEELIEAAGGVNAAHDLRDYSQIADTQIQEMAPDVILFSSTWTPEQIQIWTSSPAYADVPAIKNGRYYQLDFSLADADLQAHRAERIETLRNLIVP